MSRGVYGSTNWAQMAENSKAFDAAQKQKELTGELVSRPDSLGQSIETFLTGNLFVGIPILAILIYAGSKLFPILIKDFFAHETHAQKLKRWDVVEKEQLSNRALKNNNITNS